MSSPPPPSRRLGDLGEKFPTYPGRESNIRQIPNTSNPEIGNQHPINPNRESAPDKSKSKSGISIR